jgi:hypothetical protein
VHWRLLKDGSIVLCTSSFADKAIENAVNAPLDKGAVRADIMGGYHMKRCGNDSVNVRYLAAMDLKVPTPI